MTLEVEYTFFTKIKINLKEEYIFFARNKNYDLFERSDVYDWLAGAAASSSRYDVVFSSYGALIWLSDIVSWAAGVAKVLRPGGRLVLVDFHPMAMIFAKSVGSSTLEVKMA